MNRYFLGQSFTLEEARAAFQRVTGQAGKSFQLPSQVLSFVQKNRLCSRLRWEFEINRQRGLAADAEELGVTFEVVS